MTNIIKFPSRVKAAVEATHEAVEPIHKRKSEGVTAALVKGIWVLTVLIWPILKWVVSLDCVFQFVRMMHHWNTPGVYAGWTFLLHFFALTALTYFVSIYKPRGL